MCAAVLFYAPIPLLLAFASESIDIVVAAALMYLVQLPIFAGYHWASHYFKRVPFGTVQPLEVIHLWSATKWRYRLPSMVFAVDWLLYAFALSLLEPAVVVVVYEFWPVFFLVIAIVVDRITGERNCETSSNARTVSLMLLGAVGVGLAVVSEGGVWAFSSFLNFGVTVALTSSLFGALVNFIQKRGGEIRNLRANASVLRVEESAKFEAAISCSLSVVSKFVVGGCMLLFIAISRGLLVTGFTSVLFAVSAGILNVAGNVLFNTALHLDDDGKRGRRHAIVSLYYAVPVLSLIWFWGFGELNVARSELLIVGVFVVVTVNVIMHLPSIRYRSREIVNV